MELFVVTEIHNNPDIDHNDVYTYKHYIAKASTREEALTLVKPNWIKEGYTVRHREKDFTLYTSKDDWDIEVKPLNMVDHSVIELDWN